MVDDKRRERGIGVVGQRRVRNTNTTIVVGERNPRFCMCGGVYGVGCRQTNRWWKMEKLYGERVIIVGGGEQRNGRVYGGRRNHILSHVFSRYVAPPPPTLVYQGGTPPTFARMGGIQMDVRKRCVVVCCGVGGGIRHKGPFFPHSLTKGKGGGRVWGGGK